MTHASDPQLVVQPAPFLRPQVSTPRIMGDVLIALAPAFAAGLWFFGLSALLVILASTAACVATDWALGGRAQLADLSAVVTGVLVGLILPPSLPLWMAALGGFVAIALGKVAWGGLGHNLFNPALVGRAFLQAAFPIALTTWVPPQGLFALYSGNLALPFMSAPADAVTSATPLGQMKFLAAPTPLADLFWGNVSGSIGETSAAAILLGGLYLVARRACDWRLPAGMLGAAALLAELFHQLEPAKYPGAPLHAALRRTPPRGGLHGERSGDLAALAARRLDLRRRRRRPGGAHPLLGRAARGGDVRHPADELGESADRPRAAAAAFRRQRPEGEPVSDGARFAAQRGAASRRDAHHRRSLLRHLDRPRLPHHSAAHPGQPAGGARARGVRGAAGHGASRAPRLGRRERSPPASAGQGALQESIFAGYGDGRCPPGLRRSGRRGRFRRHHQADLRARPCRASASSA